MNFEEHAAKPLLAAAGIHVPRGELARTPDEAATAARRIGAAVVKAQVPTGKRGKAGGIRAIDSPDEARAAAAEILGMTIATHTVERVLVEARAEVARELYAAVLNDPASKGPLVMLSSEGGMDIEEVAAARPERLRRATVDIRTGFTPKMAHDMLSALALDACAPGLADVLVKLYAAFRDNDAELLEINPLAVLADGEVTALDCKLVVDDSGLARHPQLRECGSPAPLTPLEARGEALGLKYIELDGDIAILANGAGLTMTTMDVVTHHGGRPANFLEIGGAAYTQARPALELVLDNPKVKSLVINFCGAFARTDVMSEGVIDAWEALAPALPVFFSVHGTGSAQARVMLRERLGVTPFATMDEAVAAAVRAADAQRDGAP